MADDDFIEVKYRDNRKTNRGSYRGSHSRGERGKPASRAHPNPRFRAQHVTQEKVDNVDEECIKGKERITECL